MVPALLLLASCQAGPVKPPSSPRELEIAGLVEHLGDSETDQRLVLIGEEAVTALLKVIRESPDPARRGRSARVLGLMYRTGTNPLALSAYVEVLKESGSAAVVRELLVHAHFFNDPDGTVRTLLLAYISKMTGASADMVTGAAVLAGDGAVEALKAYVYRTQGAKEDAGREVAIRAIGRAARHGRSDAAEFLVNCTTLENEALAASAARELYHVCGHVDVKNWRGWWLEHAKQERVDWIAESVWKGRGRPFDPRDRGMWGELVGGLDPKEDLEPEFALIGERLGLDFGYLSPRDAFDPTLSDAVLRENNERAVATLKAWWRENALYLSPAAGRRTFKLDPDARERKVPVQAAPPGAKTPD